MNLEKVKETSDYKKACMQLSQVADNSEDIIKIIKEHECTSSNIVLQTAMLQDIHKTILAGADYSRVKTMDDIRCAYGRNLLKDWPTL